MSKYTIIFYAIIVGVAILSSILKKQRKAAKNNQAPTKKPTSSFQPPVQKTYQQPQTTQPKSLEDILQSLLNPQSTVVIPPKTSVNTNIPDKKEIMSPPPVNEASLEEVDEEKYYGFDTELEYDEEMEDYDKMADHHVHGVGFDEITEMVMEEETSGEFEDIDWRKAVITAEILKRPQY